MREAIAKHEFSPKRTTTIGWFNRAYRLTTPQQTCRDNHPQQTLPPMLLPAIRLHRVISKDQTEPKRKRQEISVASIKKKSTMLEEYEMKNKIGSGAFAEVFVALNPGGKGKFVVKIYDKFKLYDKQRKLNIKNEISILKKLNHPNIIELVEVIENPKTINLVMEHFSEISLRKAIGDRGKFNEGECKKVIKQLAEAIQYMHREGIAHRDVKMQNVLVDQHLNVKLIDFGFAVQCSGLYESSMVGTPNYLCPEQLTEKQYDPFKADVWALGVLFYYLMMGYFPFRGQTKLLYKKISKCELMFPHDINPGCEYLLRKMLNPSFEQRVSIQQLLQDAWIKPINFKEQISLLEKTIRRGS